MPFLTSTFSWRSRLAVKYQFLASDGDESSDEFQVDSFNAVQELNDYEVCTRLCVSYEKLTAANQLDPMVASRPDRQRTYCTLLLARVRDAPRRVWGLAAQDEHSEGREAKTSADPAAGVGRTVGVAAFGSDWCREQTVRSPGGNWMAALPFSHLGWEWFADFI